MIKKCTHLLLVATLLYCTNLFAQTGQWIQKKSLYNLVAGRSHAIAFSIKDKGYLGTGFSYGFGTDGGWNNDLWQYDTLTDSWTQMASMPVPGRQSAFAFVINDKAYVGAGVTGFGSPLNDLWQYDPSDNSWVQKASMPNSGLSGALSFTLNNKGYVGFGFNADGRYQRGIWSYNASTDKWVRKNNFPAITIWESFALSDGTNAYAGLGYDSVTFRYVNDIWQYDAASDSWTRKNDFNGKPRFNEAGFVVNNKLYLVGGENGNTYKFINDGWVYDKVMDKWTSIGQFTGPPRGNAATFTIGDNGYIGTGYDAESSGKELGDLWQLNTKNLQWRKRADLGGGPRDLAVSFNVNAAGIVATGEDGTRFKKDVWAYNTEKDSWKQLADLPYGKNGAAGFSIGNKMYIGLGLVDTSHSLINPVTKSKDFWMFNPAKNAWTQIADFGGGNRGAAISFVLNGKAYVGTGFADNGVLTNDLWQYNPAQNIWTRKADFPGTKRSYAIAFAINGKGYAGMGSGIRNNLKDMYEYDPASNTWSAKADFPAKVRAYSTAVANDGKGYAGLGVDNQGNFYNDWWQFDPQQNTWTRQADFPNVRWGASALSAGNKIYVGMGVPDSGQTDTMFAINDWWQFIPQTATTQQSNISKTLAAKIIVSPNPFKDEFKIQVQGNNESFNVVVNDENGKTVETRTVTANTINYLGKRLTTGIFFVHVFNGANVLPVQKVIKRQ
ncbi:MAG: T9SS type A sorting domain-containing protein [Parafilimonas sp.]|nr:T9SS type A sorting domain-containing protein [Parafilimonas sp.]